MLTQRDSNNWLFNGLSQCFSTIFSCDKIRLNTLSARTAATQLSSYKKTEHKKAVLLFHNIYHHFASTIFKIATQRHSTLNALDALRPGPPRGGGQGMTMTSGPMDFRGPMGSRGAHHGAVGFRGPSRGLMGLWGGPLKWHWEISMWSPKAFFGGRGDHLNSTRKTVRISVKTFFFFLEITSYLGPNCCIFSVCFGLHKTGNLL